MYLELKSNSVALKAVDRIQHLVCSFNVDKNLPKNSCYEYVVKEETIIFSMMTQIQVELRKEKSYWSILPRIQWKNHLGLSTKKFDSLKLPTRKLLLITYLSKNLPTATEESVTVTSRKNLAKVAVNLLLGR